MVPLGGLEPPTSPLDKRVYALSVRAQAEFHSRDKSKPCQAAPGANFSAIGSHARLPTATICGAGSNSHFWRLGPSIGKVSTSFKQICRLQIPKIGISDGRSILNSTTRDVNKEISSPRALGACSWGVPERQEIAAANTH